jgi:hypothetical protein
MEAPYYGSGSSATTSGSAAGGATTITLADASTFRANQGIFVRGAGVGGIDYVGTVQMVAGNVVTFSPALTGAAAPASTTTTGTNNPGQSLSVANTGVAYQGRNVSIGGAGPAGSTYYGVITKGGQGATGAGTIYVSPATSTTVAAGAVVTVDNVLHDDTAALQAVINAVAAAGGGKVILPANGYFRCNAPSVPVYTGRLAILLLPTVLYEAGSPPLPLTFEGPVAPLNASFTSPRDTRGGAVIQTDAAQWQTALMSGYNAASTTYGPFTNVFLNLQNVTLRSYDNPNVIAVDARYLAAFEYDGLAIDTGVGQVNQPTFPPTNLYSMGFETGYVNCSLPQNGGRVFVHGYTAGAKLHEHAHIAEGYFDFCTAPVVLDTPVEVLIDKMVADVATTVIQGTCGALKISQLRADQVTTLVYDPSNNIHGSISVNTGSGTQTIVGAANLIVEDLNRASGRIIFNGALAGVTSQVLSGLLSSKRYVIQLQVASGGTAGTLVSLLPNGSATGCALTYLSVPSSGSYPTVTSTASASYVGYPGNTSTVGYVSTITIYPRINGFSLIKADIANSATFSGQVIAATVLASTDYTSLTLSSNYAITGWLTVTEYAK